ncbi:MAG: hypothetical protein KAI29_07365, partial [Cyclobacteriaceae bacterium]|nr:hypothetical protein [Cyclobacteriaceae bacterium]
RWIELLVYNVKAYHLTIAVLKADKFSWSGIRGPSNLNQFLKQARIVRLMPDFFNKSKIRFLVELLD